MKRRGHVGALAGGASASLLGAALYVRALLADAQPMSLATVLGIVAASIALTALFAAAVWAYLRDVKRWGPPQDRGD